MMMIFTLTPRNRPCVGCYVMIVCFTYQIALFFDCHEKDNLGETNKIEYFHDIFVCGFGSLSEVAYLNHFPYPTVKAYYISFVYVIKQSFSFGLPLK